MSENLSLSGKANEVPWSHLLYHEKYSGLVDIYEGGFMHSRGVWRSEYNSCMNNEIPYYNTISRESIVRRIKDYAGEEYSFEDFVANDRLDKIPETSAAVRKAGVKSQSMLDMQNVHHHSPMFMGKRPEFSGVSEE